MCPVTLTGLIYEVIHLVAGRGLENGLANR
jgi:hypothetical protein